MYLKTNYDRNSKLSVYPTVTDSRLSQVNMELGIGDVCVMWAAFYQGNGPKIVPDTIFVRSTSAPVICPRVILTLQMNMCILM